MLKAHPSRLGGGCALRDCIWVPRTGTPASHSASLLQSRAHLIPMSLRACRRWSWSRTRHSLPCIAGYSEVAPALDVRTMSDGPRKDKHHLVPSCPAMQTLKGHGFEAPAMYVTRHCQILYGMRMVVLALRAGISSAPRWLRVGFKIKPLMPPS